MVIGACAASAYGCAPATSFSSECSEKPGEPGLETCDGVDDDCDGEVDEGFDLGAACTSGLGACEVPGVLVCSAPQRTQCDAVPGTPQAEARNGIDDDCDGVVDNGLGLGDACTVGVGACLSAGLVVCDALFGTTCSATPGLPSMESCDGVDDDCNGATDEGCADADGDGLSDAEEATIGTDPADADTDDDGVPDGAEPSPTTDTDGDGLINALDPDSDDDGLSDGTEMGYGCDDPATNPASMGCVPDGDLGATTTDPTKADTDDGGKADGSRTPITTA